MLPFKRANILLPKDVDMTKWSVVACDQYTSEPEYWKEVESIVGSSPSTLNLILPELYLEEENVEERIKKINLTMVGTRRNLLNYLAKKDVLLIH